jgi:hypothetical protein
VNVRKRPRKQKSPGAEPAFGKVKYQVERQMRRFAAKQRKRQGFGWKRWSGHTVYASRGLFGDYHVAYAKAKARQPIGIITPMDDASAASRMRESRVSDSRWRGPETE